jgi:hypothetical protein
MNKQVEVDLTDLTAILESFVKKLPNMSEQDKIDLAARIKPVAKHCAAIDDAVKMMVREKLHHKAGTRLGTLFKAVLKIVEVDRLDQKLLKEERPNIHLEYVKTCADERVSYELR